ncbi:MAG: C-GCAxxG-C-C family (seleno)protein [Desulfobulbaceae bacterium]
MKSRRDFLKTGVCAAVAGAAATCGVASLKVGAAKAAVGPTQAQHPFGYIPLDPEEIRQRGYDGYRKLLPANDGTSPHGECAFGTFNAIIGKLAELDPYSGHATVPTQMMEWASGGAAGFATFCGALNGACAAIGLICANSDAKLFVADLLTWYSETMLPTPLAESSLVPLPGKEYELSQSVAASNLCHVSVTNWCLASGFASGSSERSERCARLAGDVAAKTVELLNSGMGGTLGNPRDNSTVCGQCHYKGTDYDAGQFTRGKMNCHSCHVDIEKVSRKGHKFGHRSDD